MDGILLINKEIGKSSHQIVNDVRKLLHTKKVGHCGTLDPLASGVLVLGINKATKLLQFLVNDEKIYQATLTLGKHTDTYDSEGEVLEEKTYQNDLNETMVIDVLNSFLGKQKQLPPIYSAIKVKGKKLYEYARNNEEVEIKERDIEIFNIQLDAFKENQITFSVHASKGTYIRSLCVDIAKALNYPGYMSSLARIKSGSFSIEDCFTLKQVKENNYQMISIHDALSFMPTYIVEDESIIYHGKLIESDINERVAVYNKKKELLAVYEPNGHGYLKSVRGLW